MLLTSIKCSNCGAYHDATLEECPDCHSNNELRTLKDFPKNVFFLHPVAQIAVFIIGFAYIGMLMTEIFYSSFLQSSMAIACLTYLTMAIGILAVILFTRRKLFFNCFKHLSNYVIGIVIGAIAIGLGIIISMITSIWYQGNENINQAAAESVIVVYPLLSFLLFGFLGPICEELTYRVGFYSFLRRFNKYVAIVATTIVFAFIHFRFNNEDIVSELVALPQYLLMGFLLTYAYEKGGPSASMSAHIMYNIASTIMTLMRYYYGQHA